MSRDRLSLAPGLEEFLKALRAAGLPVGAREVLRLHRVFLLEPRLGQERGEVEQLRRILLAALVHSPAEQAIFEPVFRVWLERWERLEGRSREQLPGRGKGTALRVEGVALAEVPKTFKRVPMLLRALIAVFVMGGVVWTLRTPNPAEDVVFDQELGQGAVESSQGESFQGESFQGESFQGEFSQGESPWDVMIDSSDREEETGTLVERGFSIDVIEGKAAPIASGDRRSTLVYRFLSESLIVGIFLQSFVLVLIWTYKRRLRAPKKIGKPALPGPRRVPYLPLEDQGPELLDREAAKAMVWSVGRYQTERFTSEIDLWRTVAETSRAAGMPELRFVPEQQVREVWLWVDGSIDDPAPGQYAEEIASALRAAGLPVRIAGFDGYPLDLEWHGGQRFRSQEMEAHRQSALVAILTDGVALEASLRDTRSVLVRALLNSFSCWEKLIFVDCSEKQCLGKILASHGLRSVLPEALPYVLGFAGAAVPVRTAVDPGALKSWSAALALSPRFSSREEAYALRRQLGLDISPWELPASPQDKISALRWLRDSEGEGVISESELDQALQYWQKRLDKEDRRRREWGAIESWDDRPAQRFLEMERAFLQLWREPDAAALRLSALAEHDGDLEVEIRRRLAGHGAEGMGSEKLIELPWSVGELTVMTRERLRDLGFRAGSGRLRAPGQLGLAIGLLAGLGSVVLAHGLITWADVEPPMVTGNCTWRVGIHEASQMRFVNVCGGRFLMGAGEGDGDEKPKLLVQSSEFWIGEREVSNAEYRLWQPNHELAKPADLPVVNVSWEDARAFCRWLGDSEMTADYDLPTEAQWEYAARGSDGRRYPWGDPEPTVELAVFGRRFSDSPELVDSFHLGVGPFGTLHQAGNVWEWVLDCYDEEAYEKRRGELPVDPVLTCDETPILPDETPIPRVLRGGSFMREPRDLRSTYRDWSVPMRRSTAIGFRCIRSADPQS